ncbi:MAG: sulfatase [Anaerolineae bacterium]|jgi:arylsulfatase A-like enzyme|nr:sulfatase [Anaerolineae bacterium]
MRAILLLGLLLGLIGCAPIESAASRPNIIVIITDDQNYQTIAMMPILQRELIAKGIAFEQAFTTISKCCPARTSLLRGQYTHNHQIWMNQPPNGGFERFQELRLEDSTLATWLRAAGYRTALIGKYLNGYPSANDVTYVPKGWDQWFGWWIPRNDEPLFGYYRYRINENGQDQAYGDQPSDYSTDVLAQHAVNFIRDQRDQAFFLYIAPFAPHGPVIPAPRHQNLFTDAPLPRPPSFNEADVSDKPSFIQDRPLLTADQITDLTAYYRDHLRSLQAVDELIDQILTALETIDATERTYVLFLTDNGYHWGLHREPRGKGDPYETEIRIPLIIRGPSIPAGMRSDQLVTIGDLAPTIAALTGVTVPEWVDGTSLIPLWGSESVAWRERLVINSDRYQALRTTRYLYVEHDNGERELYDLITDPDQLENIIHSADPALIADLEGQLDAILNCAGAECRTAEGQKTN